MHDVNYGGVDKVKVFAGVRYIIDVINGEVSLSHETVMVYDEKKEFHIHGDTLVSVMETLISEIELKRLFNHAVIHG
jgi:hypothetical protein